MKVNTIKVYAPLKIKLKGIGLTILEMRVLLSLFNTFLKKYT